MTPASDKEPKSKGQAMPPKQLKLDMPPDLEATYANLVRIAHTPSEMVFDFARLLPGDTGAKVMARVLMSPLSAKLFHRALAENLSKYESIFGEIAVPTRPSGLADFLFRGTQPPSEEPPENPQEE